MLNWFEENPARYWLVVCLVLAPIAFAIARPLLRKGPPTFQRSDWLWGGVIFLLLLVGRWPTLVVTQEYNPDESVFIAALNTYRYDPVPWRSVDTVTSGPANIYALGPVAAIHGSNDYFAARVTALLLLTAALLFAHQSIAMEFGSAVARASTFPAVMMEALTLHPDFLHYSSELLSICLLSASFLLIWRQTVRPPRVFFSALAGLLLGTVPWAKLQAAPIALVLGLIGLTIEIIGMRRQRPDANSRVFAMAAAAVFPTLFLATLLTLTRQWHHALISYVSNNVTYVHDGGDNLRQLISVWRQNLSLPGTLFITWGSSVIVACSAWLLISPPRKGQRGFVLIVAVFLVISLVCVVTPHRPFTHYLQLIVIPGTLLLGSALGSMSQTFLVPRWTLPSRWIAASSLIPCLILFFLRAPLPHPVVKNLDFYRRPPDHPVVKVLRRYANRSEALSVWGWRNHYYAEAGMRQGTREAFTAAQIFPSRYWTYYRERYLQDLRTNRPAAFIDASIAPEYGFTQDNLKPEAYFPALGDWLKQNYTVVATIDSNRIFIRNDKLTSR